MSKIKIGKTQLKVLRSLRNHNGWSNGCGWVWTTPLATRRYMDRLVEKGLATVTEDRVYQINHLGKLVLEGYR